MKSLLTQSTSGMFYYIEIIYKKMNPGAKLRVLINSNPNQEVIIPLVGRMLNDT